MFYLGGGTRILYAKQNTLFNGTLILPLCLIHTYVYILAFLSTVLYTLEYIGTLRVGCHRERAYLLLHIVTKLSFFPLNMLTLYMKSLQ
jgi:hypothetical protein